MTIDGLKPGLTAHMIVCNEARWVWFSIMSVIEQVDRMIIYDTGSMDNTVAIIKSIVDNPRYSEKVIFEEKGTVSSEDFYKLRTEQIERTDTEYFIVVDGDEIWYEDALLQVKQTIERKKPALIAVKFINCAGDMFHYRNYERETYSIKGIKGSLTVRVFSMRIPGIHCSGTYGIEGYVTENELPVQQACDDIVVVDAYYFHMTYLQRSDFIKGDFAIAYRRKKFKAFWDKRFSSDFNYPEVLYLDFPSIVKNPWTEKVGVLDYMFCFLRKLIYVLKNR